MVEEPVRAEVVDGVFGRVAEESDRGETGYAFGLEGAVVVVFGAAVDVENAGDAGVEGLVTVLVGEFFLRSVVVMVGTLRTVVMLMLMLIAVSRVVCRFGSSVGVRVRRRRRVPCSHIVRFRDCHKPPTSQSA